MHALLVSLALAAGLFFQIIAAAATNFADDARFETDAQNPEFVSIITGVSDYANTGIADLPGVESDLQAMKTLADQLKHAVYVDPQDVTKRLTSLPPKEFLKRISVGIELSDPKGVRKIGGNDVVYFYFSGHGFSFNNENYLALRTIDPGKPFEGSVSISDLVSALAVRRPRVIVLVLDMCRTAIDASLAASETASFLAVNSQTSLTLPKSELLELQPWQEARPGDQGIKLFAFFSTTLGSKTYADVCPPELQTNGVCAGSPFTTSWIELAKDWKSISNSSDPLEPWTTGDIQGRLNKKYLEKLRAVDPGLSGQAVMQFSDPTSVPPVYSDSRSMYLGAERRWNDAAFLARKKKCLSSVVGYAHDFAWSPNRVAALEKIKTWQDDALIGPTIGTCPQANNVASAACQVIKNLQSQEGPGNRIAVSPNHFEIAAPDSAVCRATELQIGGAGSPDSVELQQLAQEGLVSTGVSLKEASEKLLSSQYRWDTQSQSSFETLVLNNSATSFDDLSRSLNKAYRDPGALLSKLETIESVAQSFPTGSSELEIAWLDPEGGGSIERPGPAGDFVFNRTLSAEVKLPNGSVDFPIKGNSNLQPVDFGEFLGKLDLVLGLEGNSDPAKTFEDTLKNISAANTVFFITIAYSDPSDRQSEREIGLVSIYDAILNAAFRSKIDYSQIVSARSNELAGGPQNFDIRFFGVRK
jgi:Caspase domain